MAELKTLSAKAGEFENHQKKRELLLDAFDNAKHELYLARIKVYEDLTIKSDGRLQLKLEENKNRQLYLNALVEITKGMQISQKFKEQLAEHMTPRDFVTAVLKKDKNELESKGLLTTTAATKIIEAIPANEELLKKLLALPYESMLGDVPDISYKKDDGIYYPLAQLSVGQKCTALLLIALSEGSMPIIIDQPEDALDVATV